MLRDQLNLPDILLGFENTLLIEYTEKDTEKLIQNVRKALENKFKIRFGEKSLYDLQIENMLISDSISVLLASLTKSMESLSLFLVVTLFDNRHGITLKDTNYLGFAKENLEAALKYLQSESLYEQRKTFFPALVRATSKIPISNIKRMLVIMEVLEALGVKEGVCLFSQLLYLGVVYDD